MIANYLVLDTENSGAQRNKAHPFDPRNKLLVLGIRSHSNSTVFDIDYSEAPYGDLIRNIWERLRRASILVGFNIKYDLHWLRRYGFKIPQDLKIWDCQLAEFLLSNQLNAYPSLAESCLERGVSLKKDILSEYLKQGLDVSDIPLPELTEYLEGDLISTEELFLKQIPLIKDRGLWNLFRLQCQDLLVLADMEYNGIKYNIEKSMELANEQLIIEKELTDSLVKYLPPEVAPYFNWGSGDQLSALLYGGKITFEWSVPNGVYKTGKNIGKQKNKWLSLDYVFPRLVEPLEGSALKKEGFYKTDYDTLKALKAKGDAKQIIDTSIQLSEISKLRGTYYEGIPKKFEEFGWEDNLVHGQLNQCVAVTGRTSSSNPNGQNIPTDGKVCFESRYA